MRLASKTIVHGATVVALCIVACAAVPDGFDERTIFQGSFMTDIAFAPNDFMFVSQKMGIVNVYEPGENYRYEKKTKVLDIQDVTCDNQERGLGSVQVHPKFEETNWVYTYYTYKKNGNCGEDKDDGPVNRLSRWTYDPEKKKFDSKSEEVFFETAPLIGSVHNSGNIEFGSDGLLYVTCGDGRLREESQEVDNLFGSMIRLTDNGDIPGTNPFANDPEGVRCNETGLGGGKCQELYAIGLRNPWKFAMDPNTPRNKVRMFITDVGASTWEEISEAGTDWENATKFGWNKGIQNFGWPEFEGPCTFGDNSKCIDDDVGFSRPVHFYRHQGGGAATVGAFVPNGVWGPEYDNVYLWGDFFLGWIRMWDSNAPVDHCFDDCKSDNPKSRMPVKKFTSYPDVISMRFGPYIDGRTALYFTSSAYGGVMRQVVCKDCVFSTPSPPPTPVEKPVVPTVSPPRRPEGEGGYPGVLFPWSEGLVCPKGYDYCGVLEFCMSNDSATYGYRLPCPPGESCECSGTPGPLIRLSPGKVYKLMLRNSGTEVTNLHTHGLHIVGAGNADDVTREVTGGHCLDYEWDLKDDHPGGTYWYHAHRHKLSEKQVGGGAFGLLIVDDNTLLNPVLPSWAGNERLLQISVFERTYELFANGRKNEVIDIGANQWYRLRVSIALANAVPYNLTFDDQGICDIHRVASDGVWHSEVPGPKAISWELTGASRADFAIRCSTPNALVRILYRHEELVAQIWVGEEDESPYNMEAWTPTRPASLANMLEETVPEANKFAVRLGFDYVNDNKRWDPVIPLATIAYDQVHEWVLQDTNVHPFHLHLYHMQIASPGGCGAHEQGEFYDTIAAAGNCTVRFRTADIGQRCVLHCHVLFHEDNGSMSWVNVTGPNMPMNTVQSFEHTCNSVSLPTRAPTTSSCVPGLLGISSEQSPLLKGDIFANEEYGVFIKQEDNGNLVVRRGTPQRYGEVIWASGGHGDDAKSYFTDLQGDSNLITWEGSPGNKGDVVWKTQTINPSGDFFLGVDCSGESVSIFAGSWKYPHGSTALWNSASTLPVPVWSSAPLDASMDCIPGFLGLGRDLVLQDGDSFVNQEYGVFIEQHTNGNLVVRHGSPQSYGGVIWESGVTGNAASSYSTILQGDSNLITFEGTPSDKGDVLWETQTINPDGDFFLGIDCNKQIVSVYSGTSSVA